MPQCPEISVPEALRRMRLFNEKAAELKELSFVPKAFAVDAGSSVHFDFDKRTIQQEKRGADRESTAAFALTFRMFLQPRDCIQLQQMAEVYQQMLLPDEYKSRVAESLRNLETFLDKTDLVEIAINGQKITHRAVLETFLYGHLAHINEEKRATYEVWKSGPAFLMLESQFEYVVGEVWRVIEWLRAANADAIQLLQARAPS